MHVQGKFSRGPTAQLVPSKLHMHGMALVGLALAHVSTRVEGGIYAMVGGSGLLL